MYCKIKNYRLKFTFILDLSGRDRIIGLCIALYLGYQHVDYTTCVGDIIIIRGKVQILVSVVFSVRSLFFHSSCIIELENTLALHFSLKDVAPMILKTFPSVSLSAYRIFCMWFGQELAM